ncbi:hypothetical protein [Enterococcus hermanniensis]|nr:hypothetical protein [Enterococcus hermanniensis]
MIDLTVKITRNKTVISLEDEGSVILYQQLDKIDSADKKALLIYYSGRKPMALSFDKAIDKQSLKIADSIAEVQLGWEVELKNLAQLMLDAWIEKGIEVSPLFEVQKVASNQFSIAQKYQATLFEVLKTFGYENEKIKAKPTKAQHRWSKALSEIPFYIDYKGARAEVIWQKRNELRIKSGAILAQEIPLNKDGSVGFSARLTEKLRSDHGNKIKDYVTVEDIILKSVNEVGIFLYFAGTNGWLVLKDSEGKTIDAYSVVN